MSDVQVRGVRKRFGATQALDGIDLDVASGSLLAVLGPSGCGKTTLLRCLAGFERIDEGTVRLAGTEVAGPGRHLPSHRRQVAVVPQDGALFPHLSVAGNVGFGLDRSGRRARVAQCLELVGLGGYERRMPHQLSGGQQQRVAVARALAPRPPLVLLDEPFSALDASLRAELRRDVRLALREDGATALLVTHDQAEALSMADQVAVMRDGRILQSGSGTEVYRRPSSPWVAQFVGDAMLLRAIRSAPGRARCSLGEVSVPLDGPGHEAGTALGESILVLVRPEQVVPVAERAAGVETEVLSVAYHGHDALVSVRLPDGSLGLVRTSDETTETITDGQRLRVAVTAGLRAFPDTGEAGTYLTGD